MLHTLLNILHVFVCIFLILVVLLQQGKGGGLGPGTAGSIASPSWGTGVLQGATSACRPGT